MQIKRNLWWHTRSLFAVLVATLMLSTTAWADDDDDDDDGDDARGCYSAAVESLPDFPESGNNFAGKAKLCISDAGLDGRMRVKNATWMNVYTVWWVYIDENVCPGGGFFGCLFTFFGTSPELDLFGNQTPYAVFGRMDSAISGRNGKLKFANRLDDMRVSSGSQVWLLMFGHGMKSDDGRQLARQLLTPEDPGSGSPHLGIFRFEIPGFGPVGFGYPAAVAIFEIP